MADCEEETLCDEDVHVWWQLLLSGVSLFPSDRASRSARPKRALERTEVLVRTRLVKNLVVSHYGSNPRAVCDIVASEPYDVIAEVFTSCDVPDSLLCEVASTFDLGARAQSMRRKTATNPYLPETVLWEYLRNGDLTVHLRLASNLALTELLAIHLFAIYRKTFLRVAMETVEQQPLAVSDDRSSEPVLFAGEIATELARNPQLPFLFLDYLVRMLAIQMGGTGGQRRNDVTEMAMVILSAVAANPSSHGETLHFLAQSHDLGLLRNIIRNPATLEQTFTYIYSEHSTRLGPYLAGSPYAPQTVLTLVARDENVHNLLAENPSTPPRILARMVRQNFSKNPGNILASLAHNPGLPDGSLLLLARSDEKVRRELSIRPCLPDDVLTVLARTQDGAGAVAKQRLGLGEVEDADFLASFSANAAFVLTTGFPVPPHTLATIVERVDTLEDEAFLAMKHPECPTSAIRDVLESPGTLENTHNVSDRGNVNTLEALRLLWVHENAPQLLRLGC